MSSGRDTVVVTGGAGFIGSELVRQLIAGGNHVTVVDNLVNGKRENLADLPPAGFTLLATDIRDVGEVTPLFRRATAVYHLACLGVRHSVHAPVENHSVNASGTLGLLEVARAADVPRFVYVSSSEVYGTARWTPMSEEHPTFPCTVYGASKLAGECYARAFHATYGYPTVMVRPFNTYGPRSHHEGDSGEVIPKFLLRCLAGRPLIIFGDGSQTRDFTHVSDSARGIILAGTSDAAIGRTINIGSGTEVTINDLAITVARSAGRPDAVVAHDEPRPGDVLRLCADISQARTLLAYEPRLALGEGLSALLGRDRTLGDSPDQLLEDEVVRNWDIAAR